MNAAPNSRIARVLGSRLLLVGLLAGTALVAVIAVLGGSSSGRARAQDSDLGASLFSKHCSSCHGVDGGGVVDRGPSLLDEGRAAVDFVLRTGRMPLASPQMQATRGPVRFSEEEIVALVDYAGGLGNGPDIPDVDPATGDLADGGELYRVNCAACHVASGSGAPVGGDRRAPSLMSSTPTEIGEAILIGPGSMPVFGSFTQRDVNSVAAYIENLSDQHTTGVASFGGAGPVAEGLAAWILGLIPLIALTRWIGAPKAGRDEAERDDDTSDAPDGRSGDALTGAAT